MVPRPKTRPPPSAGPRVQAVHRTHGGDGPDLDVAAPTPHELGGSLNFLQLLASVLGPTTLLTALAFYFGWERTNILLSYFGVDPSLVSFGAQDYLLRAVDGVFTPLVVLFAVGLLALAIHRVVQRALRPGTRPSLVRWMARAVVALGLLLFIYGITVVLQGEPFPTHYLIPPLCLGIGASLTAYGLRILEGLQSDGAFLHARWWAQGMPLCAAAIVALSLFWGTSAYAQAVGRGRALDIANRLYAQPAATVYSHDRLGIDSPDAVVETPIGDEHSRYRYKYTGLRLLLKSGGKYFLLPADWQQHRGALVILPDDTSIRLSFDTSA
jgi:hypothetical protein